MEFNWEWLVNLMLPFAAKIIDSAVDGGKLPVNGVHGVQTLYALAQIWGKQLVDSTETNTDDQALSLFLGLCVDCASEGSFSLPNFE